MLSRLAPVLRASRRILNTSTVVTSTASNPTLPSASLLHFRLASTRLTTTTILPQHPPSSHTRTYATTPMAAATDTSAETLQNTTGITPDSLAQTLRSKLDATHVQIDDISGGCGASFEAVIVSPQFQGKTLLARSRLVNATLKKEIAAIHAWTPRCLTPEQWEKEKDA